MKVEWGWNDHVVKVEWGWNDYGMKVESIPYFMDSIHSIPIPWGITWGW